MEEVNLSEETIKKLATATAEAIFARAESAIENQEGFLGLWLRAEFEKCADVLKAIIEAKTEKQG